MTTDQVIFALGVAPICGLLWLIYRTLGVISWHLSELRKNFRPSRSEGEGSMGPGPSINTTNTR